MARSQCYIRSAESISLSTSLPDNLTVGGSLYLRETAIKGAVYGCGNSNRAIYAYKSLDGIRKISLGCFVGTQSEAIDAVKGKYGDTEEAAKYIAAINEAFEFHKKRIEQC
jgi:hypothetical protein